MAVAKLRIEVEGGADVRRMLGQIGTETKRANAAMAADSRSTGQTVARSAQQAARDQIRAQRDVTDAQKRASGERKAASHSETREVTRDESEKTKAARTESGNRVKIAESEANGVQRAQRQQLTYTQLVEREKTAIVRRELQLRARDEARAAHDRRELSEPQAGGSSMRYQSRWGQVAFNAFGAARTAASNIHSGIQGARERDAGISRNLGLALYQSGANATEVRAARTQFGRYAAEHGLDASQLAQAALAAQSEFSVFGAANTTGAQRGPRIQQFLETARLAVDTGNDPAEFARLGGMLNNSGLDAATQRQMLLFAAGGAQRGAVEVGALTRQAMPAITGRIAQAQAALGQGATPEQRAAAAQQAFQQSYAELQVARGMEGVSPTMAGNAFRNMNSALASNVTQQKMLQNIRTTPGFTAMQRQQLQAQLFESNGAGGMRLRSNMTNALNLVGAAGGVLGNDATAFGNLFAGGGHGNPQSLQANWRRIAGGMLGTTTDEQGRALTGVERVRQLMGNDTALTEQQVLTGRGIFEHDAQADLNRNQEENTNALRSNTSVMTRLSDTFADFQARNPVANALLGGAGNATSASLLARVGTFQAGGDPTGGVTQFTGALRGATGALTGLAGGLAALGFGLAVGDLVNHLGHQGLAEGRSFDMSVAAEDVRMNRVGASRVVQGEATDESRGASSTAGQRLNEQLNSLRASGMSEIANAILAGLPAAMRAAVTGVTVQATVTPQDAAHAASEARSQPSGSGHS